MALEASASIKTVQQINNQTMIDLDQMRRQLNTLQDENDKLKEQLSQQVRIRLTFLELIHSYSIGFKSLLKKLDVKFNDLFLCTVQPPRFFSFFTINLPLNLKLSQISERFDTT